MKGILGIAYDKVNISYQGSAIFYEIRTSFKDYYKIFDEELDESNINDVNLHRAIGAIGNDFFQAEFSGKKLSPICECRIFLHWMDCFKPFEDSPKFGKNTTQILSLIHIINFIKKHSFLRGKKTSIASINDSKIYKFMSILNIDTDKCKKRNHIFYQFRHCALHVNLNKLFDLPPRNNIRKVALFLEDYY